MDELLSIGEFSSRCGLSVKVLRSYAEAGLLVPAVVDSSSGYRYYDPAQLDCAELVVLLRRAGIPVADISRFLAEPSGEAIEGWQRSLVAEVLARREALAEVRCRLGLHLAQSGEASTVGIHPVQHRSELQEVFDLLSDELTEPTPPDDGHLADLDAAFPVDRTLMIAAREDGRTVGGALGFRRDEANATLRMIGLRPGYRHRGLGRRLVERVEHEARRLGVERIALGTEEAVGFWHHLGYVPHLLFQWVFEPSRYQAESAAVLAGPLVGRRHWGSSFNDVPQLFVELDEPRLDLRDELGRELSGSHLGFVMIKSLAHAV